MQKNLEEIKAIAAGQCHASQDFSRANVILNDAWNELNHVLKRNERNLAQDIIRCADCKYWEESGFLYHGNRPCEKHNGRFFVGGGDNNDGLYTSPDFGCVDGEKRT
ncbi:MAG: hypothetical protein ACYDBV_15415 [Nitrospiria bacterium]